MDFNARSSERGDSCPSIPHIALHRTFWEDQGADLILPWFEVIAVVLGGWILVLVATLVPVRKATQITPSKALSSPD